MTEPIDVLGTWWVPGDDSTKASGVFTWTDEAGGTLRLNGRIRPLEWDQTTLPDGTVQRGLRMGPESDVRYPVIHGDAEGKCYTILDALMTSRRGSFTGQDAIEVISSPRVIRGRGYYPDPERLDSDRAVFEIRHLTDWVAEFGIEQEHAGNSEEGLPWMVLRAFTKESVRAKHGETDLELQFWLSATNPSPTAYTLDQGWRLSLRRDTPGSLDELVQSAADIQSLVTIGTGRPADFENVRFEHPEIARTLPGGGEVRDAFEYLVQWARRTEPGKSLNYHELFFTADQFGGAEGIERWLETAQRYRTELGRVMATRFTTSMFVSDKVMNLCAALESFDRTRRKLANSTHPHFVTQVKQCIAYAGEPFTKMVGTDTDAWAERVKKRRNDIAHHKVGLNDESAESYYWMGEKLYWLLALCLLREAEAPPVVFEQILKRAAMVNLLATSSD